MWSVEGWDVDTAPQCYVVATRHRLRLSLCAGDMQLAAIAVNEFLARLHRFRHDDNADSAIVRVSFIQAAEYREREPAASGMFSAHIGKGDVDLTCPL